MSSVLLLELVYLGAYEKLEMKERCLSLVQIVRCRPKGLHTLKFFVELYKYTYKTLLTERWLSG